MEVYTWEELASVKSSKGFPKCDYEDLRKGNAGLWTGSVKADSCALTLFAKSVSRLIERSEGAMLEILDTDAYPTCSNDSLFAALVSPYTASPDPNNSAFYFAPSEKSHLSAILSVCVYSFWDVHVTFKGLGASVFYNNDSLIAIYSVEKHFAAELADYMVLQNLQ